MSPADFPSDKWPAHGQPRRARAISFPDWRKSGESASSGFDAEPPARACGKQISQSPKEVTDLRHAEIGARPMTDILIEWVET
jgi:hypothetical protein